MVGYVGNPPTEQLAMTESAVDNAVNAGDPEYAPVEMKSAQDKLSQACAAMNDKEYNQVKYPAQQAEWGARVAERKTQAIKVQKIMKGAQQGVMELHEEGMCDIQR